MTDIELLELAAKAAGLSHPDGVYWVRNDAGDSWNPLTDDGDALRLAVKLRMEVCVWDTVTTVMASDNAISTLSKPVNGDLYAATRRAIVMAAAEIGRSMK